ncbi:MAG: type VI secretion system ATPase TssH [Thermodesulfobacteriota bacterium]|nr:type VI secretion system ATPase TssH [Thermodesulfobacteriota bacterium]
MISDMKALLAKLNTSTTTILHNAAGLCVSRSNYEIAVEHFLVKCLEDTGGDMQAILRHFEIDPGRVQAALNDALEDFKAGNAGKPVFSPLLIELFEMAWMTASIDLGLPRIRSGVILSAFLKKPTFFGSGTYVDMLKQINRETLEKEFFQIAGETTEQKETQPSAAAGPAGASAGESGEGGFVDKYCVDFTAKAGSGNIDPVFGRESEIHQIVDVLARRRKNNPILVGEPGVGKTAVIEGLALRITEGDVPEMLRDVTLLGLDMGALEAGAGMKGEFENRLKGVLDEIKASETPIILFIDEAHTLIGAGGSAGGSDAANLLKPALARGEIKTCAATTWSEYKKYFEKDPALARRFQLIKLDEPSVVTAALILRGLKDNYEKSHTVIVRDDAIAAAAEYADRYITGRFLPDKAIDLLDTSCARVKVNLTAKPPVLTDFERAIQALEREKKALERDSASNIAIDIERLEEINAEIQELEQKAESLYEHWQKEQELVKVVLDLRHDLHDAQHNGGGDTDGIRKKLTDADTALADFQGDSAMIHIEVSPDVVGAVVSDWTGIPTGKIQRDQARTVSELEKRLAERIKGQDQGLEAMAQVIKAAKSGVKPQGQPLGIFLFAGPSGVGKTETGLALADLLFGGENNVVTINMSEFQEKHTTSRLIGSPPGYVGYGEGGMLSEAVRQKPYSVVLLDEVEKAHPDVLNLFYQVFDKGILTDGEGKEISFSNTIIILTSNLGTDVITEMTAEEDKPPLESVIQAVRPLLSKHFKPALLARMTIIPYFSLAPEAMKGIVTLKLDRLKTNFKANNKMAFTWTDAVIDQIAARCTEVETGARNIDFILNGKVLPRISQTILERMGTGELPAGVALDVDENGSFAIDFLGEQG